MLAKDEYYYSVGYTDFYFTSIKNKAKLNIIIRVYWTVKLMLSLEITTSKLNIKT